MSRIVTAAAGTCRRTTGWLAGSFFVGLFLAVCRKTEDLWVESFFRSLYPKKRELWRESRILGRGLFSPLLVVVAFLLFMMLGNYAITPLTRLTLIAGLLSFSFFAVLASGIKGVEPSVSFDTDDVTAVGIVLFLIGVFFVFLSMAQVGGIPLLRPSLRYMLSPKLTIPSFLLVPALALLVSAFADRVKNGLLTRERARFRTLALSACCVLLLVLLGYRTPILGLMLVVVVTAYYTRLLDVAEVVAAGFLAAVFITVVGYYRVSAEYMWSFDPITMLAVRANFTMQIFDLLVNLSGATGITRGQLMLSMFPGAEFGPRMIIARLLDWRPGVTITATLLGPLVVDFGIYGVVIGMGILGFVLGVGHRLLRSGHAVYAGVYALLISYALIGVETGIIDLIVWGYFVAAVFLYVCNLLKSRKGSGAL